MCGIVGVVDFSGRSISKALVQSMADSIYHRGPDDEGMLYFPDSDIIDAQLRVAFAARRLSVIDLSGGHQPIANENESVWVVQNGEIYNYLSLREELVALGHVFKTHSDTEVIVHLYEEYGSSFAEKLDGMFAVALWDNLLCKLLLVRDRFGKKPLFYAEQGGRVWFGSELQALVIDPDISRDIDYDALDEYLSFMAIPAPLTIYKQIRKLPPGHVFIRDIQGTTIESYWSLHFEPKLAISEHDALDETRRLLVNAVKKRMISDVPLGAFLSGGVDSSAIVAIMAKHSDKPVNTFSIGFEETRFNELPHARKVANAYGCSHHEFIVKPDAIEVLPILVRNFGEPYADSSAIASYYLAKMTRQVVTVALNGDGGDELFAGYGHHAGATRSERWSKLPLVVRQGVLFGTEKLSNRFDGIHGLNRISNYLSKLNSSRDTLYRGWLTIYSAILKSELYTSKIALSGRDRIADIFSKSSELAGLDASLAADIAWYLPIDLLPKVDITTMANSLEARSPFLDKELAEFAARLPVSLKQRGRRSKYLLKKALYGIVPNENMHRPKQGFNVPIGRWFRCELHDFLGDHLLDGRLASRGLFRQDVVQRLFDDHQRCKADYSHQLWILLMLELWFRAFIDNVNSSVFDVTSHDYSTIVRL